MQSCCKQYKGNLYSFLYTYAKCYGYQCMLSIQIRIYIQYPQASWEFKLRGTDLKRPRTNGDAT